MGGSCPKKESSGQIYPARSEEKVRLADDRSMMGGKGATSVNHSILAADDPEARTVQGHNEMNPMIAAQMEAEAAKALQEKKVAEEAQRKAAAKAAQAKKEADIKKVEEENAKAAAQKAAEERRKMQEAHEKAEAARKAAVESGNKKAAEEAEKEAQKAKAAAAQAEKFAKEKSEQAQKAAEASAKAAALRATEEAANQTANKHAKRQQEKELLAKQASKRAAEQLARKETLANLKKTEVANIQKFVKEKQDIESQKVTVVEQRKQALLKDAQSKEKQLAESDTREYATLQKKQKEQAQQTDQLKQQLESNYTTQQQNLTVAIGKSGAARDGVPQNYLQTVLPAAQIAHKQIQDPVQATDLRFAVLDDLTSNLGHLNPIQQTGPAQELSKNLFKQPSVVKCDGKVAVQHINILRASPASYAELVHGKFLQKTDSDGFHSSGLHFTEGKGGLAAGHQMLVQLKQSLRLLKLDANLCAAAWLKSKLQSDAQKLRNDQPITDVAPWINNKAGGCLLSCSTTVSGLDYDAILARILGSERRSTLVTPGATSVGIGIYQKSAKHPIYVTLVLTGEGCSVDSSKIPKELLQVSAC